MMIEIMDDKTLHDLSPTNFEKYCLEILNAYAEDENLKDFTIEHNVICSAYDSDYQVDVFAQFTAFNRTKFKMLVECKHIGRPVERDRVEILNSRVQSLGAQKGMIMSTAGFQSGAIQFAKAHGIALVSIQDKMMLFHSFSNGEDRALSTEEIVIKRYHPPLFAELLDVNQCFGKQIYPTEKMWKEMFEKYSKEDRYV